MIQSMKCHNFRYFHKTFLFVGQVFVIFLARVIFCMYRWLRASAPMLFLVFSFLSQVVRHMHRWTPIASRTNLKLKELKFQSRLLLGLWTASSRWTSCCTSRISLRFQSALSRWYPWRQSDHRRGFEYTRSIWMTAAQTQPLQRSWNGYLWCRLPHSI